VLAIGATIFVAKYGRKIAQVTRKIIDGIFRVSDAWVKKRVVK
jgi:hypothetical protein